MAQQLIPRQFLNDILSRYIINSPLCEREMDRIGFKMEKAYYYYTDFICKNFPIEKLPFEKFINAIIAATPFLRHLPICGDQIKKHFESYQRKIPRYGCIILNPAHTKILLIKNKKNYQYSFPKGKINSKESPLECSIRETFEEIGVNVSLYIKTKHCILLEKQNGNINGYFIADGVSENIQMKPMVREEIAKICWVEIKTIMKRRKEEVFEFVFQFIDAIQLILKKMEQRESMDDNDHQIFLQQNKIISQKNLDFSGQLESIYRQFEQFCTDGCLFLAEHQIIEQQQYLNKVNNDEDKPFEELNPFLQFELNIQ